MSWASETYLHDELDGADKVHEEFEEEILLLLLHLVQTEFSAALEDFGLAETIAGVGPQKGVRHRSRGTSLDDLLLLHDLAAVLRLEVGDKHGDVVVFLLVRARSQVAAGLDRDRLGRLRLCSLLGISWKVAAAEGSSRHSCSEVVRRRPIRASRSGSCTGVYVRRTRLGMQWFRHDDEGGAAAELPFDRVVSLRLRRQSNDEVCFLTIGVSCDFEYEETRGGAERRAKNAAPDDTTMTMVRDRQVNRP